MGRHGELEKRLAMRILLLAMLLGANSSLAGNSLNIAYAGSLVTPMERSVGPHFARLCACTYYGEGRGSKALVHLIAAGLRHPDVFISADPAQMQQLLRPSTGAPLISWYATFGRSRLVLGYSKKSTLASTIQRVTRGELSVAALLKTPHIRIGRTDPQIDPKGARTLQDVAAISRPSHDAALLPAVESAAPLPEEDLLLRLESGDLDVAFLYSVEAQSRNVPSLELPRNANAGAAYAVAVLDRAANKDMASAFVRFILSGAGKTILAQSGLQFFCPTIEGDKRKALLALHG